MPKRAKSLKSKVSASFKIDPDLLEKARARCHQLSIELKRDISFSSKVEDLIRGWLEGKPPKG
jgi:hypothetical protein